MCYQIVSFYVHNVCWRMFLVKVPVFLLFCSFLKILTCFPRFLFMALILFRIVDCWLWNYYTEEFINDLIEGTSYNFFKLTSVMFIPITKCTLIQTKNTRKHAYIIMIIADSFSCFIQVILINNQRKLE